jgi:hypothetical protein
MAAQPHAYATPEEYIELARHAFERRQGRTEFYGGIES